MAGTILPGACHAAGILHPARRLYLSLETLHAVTYFSPAVTQAGQAIGLKGFWMTYFAFRAAPMGPVTAGAVEGTFANFHPARVARALPDAWGFASPESCLEARRHASAGALRALGVDEDALGVAAARLAPVLPELDLTGRALGAANVRLPVPDDGVEALWQAATTVREHRGDGHVACLVAEGVSGLQSHLMQSPAKGLPLAIIQPARGWDDDEVRLATEQLVERGLLDADGVLTDDGQALLSAVEARTDDLSWNGGLSALGEDGVAEVVDALRPSVRAVVDSGLLPFPNPIGLPDS